MDVWMSMPKARESKPKTNTSIKIDPDLWKEVKIEAIRRDIEVSELVEESLRDTLSHSTSAPKRLNA